MGKIKLIKQTAPGRRIPARLRSSAVPAINRFELKAEVRRIAPSLEFNKAEIKAVLEAHKALLG